MTFEILTLALLSAFFIALLYLLRMQMLTRRSLDETRTGINEALRNESRNLFNQLEAYSSLRDRLALKQGLPYTHNWSASPDFLQLIVDHALEHKPATILECSSGLTTLILARCCQINQRGHLYSLENGVEYAEKTRAHLDRYEVASCASVIHAPLEPVSLNGVDYAWYALDKIPDGSIDMLVIDGPPGFIQKNSRYPALPVLYDKLAEHCVIFLDDAAREDEQTIVDLWLQQFPALRHEYLRTERGCSILRRNQ